MLFVSPSDQALFRSYPSDFSFFSYVFKVTSQLLFPTIPDVLENENNVKVAGQGHIQNLILDYFH